MLIPPPPPPPKPDHSGARVHHVYFVPRHDVQWNRPIFRAPTLPALQNIHSELPFTAVYQRRHGRTA
ncbi:MAG TPA: hypothetical protein VGD81_11660 [Opitutaceae bacterium]